MNCFGNPLCNGEGENVDENEINQNNGDNNRTSINNVETVKINQSRTFFRNNQKLNFDQNQYQKPPPFPLSPPSSVNSSEEEMKKSAQNPSTATLQSPPQNQMNQSSIVRDSEIADQFPNSPPFLPFEEYVKSLEYYKKMDSGYKSKKKGADCAKEKVHNKTIDKDFKLDKLDK